MSKIHETRLLQLQKYMREQAVDCVAICNSPNLYYMTGYAPKKDERFQVAFVPAQGAPVLAVPKMYYAHSSVSCCIADQRCWIDGIDMNQYIVDILKSLGVVGGRFAVDDTFEFRTFFMLQKATSKSEFVLGSNLFTSMRMRKSQDEIDMMIKSGEMSDRAVQKVLDKIPTGMSEAELKTWIEYELSMEGMRDGFSNLIAFGPSTGSAHHVCGDTVCKPGDAIYLDLGGALEHYWSDITRSMHMGKPSDKYVEVYNRVREAQQLAFESIKPGVAACDVHKVAWDYLEKYDLAQYFTHRLGHGMGMDGHELPNLAKDSYVVLEPGMTFSCEPGVYIPGEFGIRIEDTVCVTETGAISFNHFTKDLIVI